MLALIFDFLNGFHDSANIVATMISCRAMTARAALTLVALAEFAGPFVLGVAVAKTVGPEVASPQAITIAVVMAALLRRREVYCHVSSMSDRVDAAANVFGMVVMKLT
jgi:PiT family inorganic phosphate transporter